MAALSANKKITQLANTGYVTDQGVKASTTIYAGALVGWDASGFLIACPATTAVDVFLGVAVENKVGSGTSGAVTCKVLSEAVIDVALASVAAANLNGLIYADNDNDATTATSGNTLIGTIIALTESGRCLVKLKPVGNTTP
jgi:hypothetical protein